ncbi:SAM and HD domain containing deoxynucleoside triphosphate triphosphohydrolase falten [Haematobia irritans]|uniref:SAM and HD domain containing deoxynucleoside triphosphate triphosphohydrolase falten n=1 Tax=Haematobia irritans TaxID=7368 RepID=UPI003F50355F
MMEIYDVIYGKLFLLPDVAAIVATPQFQRLKFIKQLGFLNLDNLREHEHNRYHHCIGTYHAAGLMLDALEKNTTWLSDNNNKIPILYRQAVQIAGLLHDIGHGPFSHTWERVANNYKHETVGFACVDKIFAGIDEKIFPELRANENYGIRLIKALIQGKIDKCLKLDLEFPKKFNFIFGIISNKHSEIDVDKWDYLKRDHFYLKELCNPNMDIDDIFLKAKVSECGQHIEYRYEDYGKIYNLFAARWNFHKLCYQLPYNLIRDEILKIIVNETNPKINHNNVRDINPENDMQDFLHLTDNRVLSLIESHPLSAVLKYGAQFQNTSNLYDITNEVLHIAIDIPSVTAFIKRASFDFYGCTEDKPEVIDETKTIRQVIRFKYDSSNKTVLYHIQALE